MKVFFGLSGGLGPVMRSLPIAEQFRHAGAEVAFSIYGRESQDFLASQGFPLIPDDDPTMPDPRKMIPAHSVFYNMDHYYAMAGLLDEHFLQSWVAHRIEMLQTYQPDLVFADCSPHTTIAARFLDIPLAAIVQSCYHPCGERVGHWSEQPRNLPRVTPIVNKVLERLDLPPIVKMEDLLAGQLDFVPSVPQFDPIDDRSVRYVGPLQYPLTALCDEEPPMDPPYILVYPGRWQDLTSSLGLSLVKSVIDGFAESRFHVLIATGEEFPEDLEERLPSNIRRIPRFSERMLANCALFIHHGGHGSCLAAIMQGVPSLIIPTNTEREYNARKVSRLEVGEYMLPHSYTSDHLARLASFIIEDHYREKAQNLRKMIEQERYGGAREVYALATALAKTGKR
ncbi:MAG: hypothetical protein H0Z34_03550 [Brevibacillus sp.]|nr:hypothetical protein [Brevibacillus sp.]